MTGERIVVIFLLWLKTLEGTKILINWRKASGILGDKRIPQNLKRRHIQCMLRDRKKYSDLVDGGMLIQKVNIGQHHSVLNIMSAIMFALLKGSQACLLAQRGT
ncbi:hypothetical protein ACJX0J_025748 [Zea mays]